MATVTYNRDEPRVMSGDNHRNGYRNPLSVYRYIIVTTIITLYNNENNRNPNGLPVSWVHLPIYLFIIIIAMKTEKGADESFCNRLVLL